MKLSFSTCPNDTFIFYAIANKKIDLEGIEFEISMHDIDVLNKNAASDDAPEITKISSNAYGIDLWKKYITLDAGAALGRNNGPMLVAAKYFDPKEMSTKRILIPGVNTTANLLFSVFFPVFLRFKRISESKIILCHQFECGTVHSIRDHIIICFCLIGLLYDLWLLLESLIVLLLGYILFMKHTF
jgi:predicted solute-binding protein